MKQLTVRGLALLLAFFTMMPERLLATALTNVKPAPSLSISLPPAIIVNKDDVNGNDVWDKDDVWDKTQPAMSAPIAKLYKVTASVGYTKDYTKPATLTVSGGSFKLWTDQYKSAVFVPGTVKINETVEFYIEGLDVTYSATDIKVRLDWSEGQASNFKEARAGIWEVDLHVDSLNASTDGVPSKSAEEDGREASNKADGLGKILVWNEKFADGLGIEGAGDSQPDLTPMLVEVKLPFDRSRAQLKFEYDASIPRLDTDNQPGDIHQNGTSFSLGKAGLRIWKSKNRSVEDYIEASTYYDASEIPETLYIEYVDTTAFSSQGKRTITVTAREHRMLGGNGGGEIQDYVVETKDSVAVFLLPFQLLTRDPESGVVEQSTGVVAPSKPRPEVDMELVSAKITNEGLQVTVRGTASDRLSEVMGADADRVHKLHFKANGVELGSVDMDYGQGQSPWIKVDSTTSFEETFIIPKPRPGSYVIIAETDANAAGLTGWDKVAVGIDLEVSNSTDFDELSIALNGSLTPARADSAKIYIGNRAPLPSDEDIAETGPDTNEFVGNIVIGGQNALCTVKMRGPDDSGDAMDYVDAEVRIELQQSSAVIVGSWRNTGGSSLVFQPDGFQISGETLVVNSTKNLPGSKKASFEPLVMKVGVPEEFTQSEAVKITVAGVAHCFKRFTVDGQEGIYVVKDSDDDRPKVFIPSLVEFPGGHGLIVPPDNDGIAEWVLEFGRVKCELASTLFVAGPQDESGGAQFSPVPLAMTVVEGAASFGFPSEFDSLFSPLFSAAASSEPEVGWQKPGDKITMKDLICAYKFIYTDELSQLLLKVYLDENNIISLEDEIGDYDFTYWLRLDGKIKITIEEDDKDLHPGIAAQYLWMGLNKALTVYKFRSAVQSAAPNIDLEIDALVAWRKQVGPAAAEAGVAATELYLAGIGIVNEPLDWVLVVNDVLEGHYSSLVAALPFVSRGLIAGGRALKIKNAAGVTLETFNDVAKLDAVKSLYRETDLRVMGVTMESHEFSSFMRDALSKSGGPIKPYTKEWQRGGLRKNMRKAGPVPNIKNPEAHHDFPWKHQEWFAQHGIDVNNPAFGRWITKKEHTRIEKQLDVTYEDHWDNIVAAEKAQVAAGGNMYTFEELMQKLAEARAAFPVSNDL